MPMISIYLLLDCPSLHIASIYLHTYQTLQNVGNGRGSSKFHFQRDWKPIVRTQFHFQRGWKPIVWTQFHFQRD